MRRRVIYNLLTVTALLSALGTDYLAQAGTAVRADAVVSAAEKMAVKFGDTFARRPSQPAVRFEKTRQVVALTGEYPSSARSEPQQARYCGMHMLHLPPPQA